MPLMCVHVYARPTSFHFGALTHRRREGLNRAPTANTPRATSVSVASIVPPRLATLHRSACPRSGAFPALDHSKAMLSEMQPRQQASGVISHLIHQSNPPAVTESNLARKDLIGVQAELAFGARHD